MTDEHRVTASSPTAEAGCAARPEATAEQSEEPRVSTAELVHATLQACEPYLDDSRSLQLCVNMLGIRAREYAKAREAIHTSVGNVLTVLNEIEPETDGTT